MVTKVKSSVQSTPHNITLIAAMGSDRTIGLNNTMPWHIPEDLKYFKAKTLGKTIIMGRKTFDSIGKPLPGRKTIILSSAQNMHLDRYQDCRLATNFQQALAYAAESVSCDGEIIIAGGGQVYQQALPYASRLLITRISQAFQGDTFFPLWDEQQWSIVSEKKYKQAESPYLEYAFQELKRVLNKSL